VIRPSGDQVEIEADGQRAVVVEVGGGLRSYTVDGRDVLDGVPRGRDVHVGTGSGAHPVAGTACRTEATSSKGVGISSP
jgi:hypothetical protein